MQTSKYIYIKTYLLLKEKLFKGKKISFFIFLLGSLFTLTLLISSYRYYDSNNYHEEYFSESYCSVIDDEAVSAFTVIQRNNSTKEELKIDKNENESILKAGILDFGNFEVNSFSTEKKQIKVKNISKKDKISLFEQELPLLLPVEKRYSKIASAFGNRNHPILNVKKMHEGVDFDVPYGENVYASGNGTIDQAGWQRGYGKLVKISHLNAYESRYAHLSTILVKKGQKVKRGDLIGKVGNTGLSTTAHLHYEIRINSKAVNPANYYNGNILLTSNVKKPKLTRKK